MANSHNKTQLISLQSDVFQANGVEVLIAEDDADTLIVKTALRYGITKDVICLLVHQCPRTNHCLYVTTKEGTYDIKQVREKLPSKQCEHLLLSHSFSGSEKSKS